MRKIFLILLISLVLSGAFVFSKLISKPQKQVLPASTAKSMLITSPVFTNNNPIPKQYSCDGDKVNPPLNLGNVPTNAKSLVLIVDDPDAPIGTFTHWLVWNISSQTTKIEENSVPQGAVQGKNTAGSKNWVSPCPPSGQHRYFFKVYALDITLNLSSDSDRQTLESAMNSHVIESGELMGVYKRE